MGRSTAPACGAWANRAAQAVESDIPLKLETAGRYTAVMMAGRPLAQKRPFLQRGV